MGDTALTGQALRAQIVSDPAQAAALRALFTDGAADIKGNVAIVLLDGDGVDGQRATIELDSGPAAATIPSPSADRRFAPAGRGITTDGNTIETTDGYKFEFKGNEVRIDWPGRHNDGSAETRFVGNRAVEGDGTEWEAQDGNYLLPNGAMFTLEYGDNGKINNFTLVHGDSRVDVAGIGQGKPRIGNVRDGGYDYRMDRVESNVEGPTFRMGGTNDGYSDLDITWNVEQYGQNLGGIANDGDGGFIDPFQQYTVDPELRPEFGTEDYERMIRAEIEDVRSILSGNAQAAGATDAYGDAVADYMLQGSGTYQRYNNELEASYAERNGVSGNDAALMQQIEQFLQSLFAGMPQVHGNFEQAMSAVQQLMQQYQQSQGMQNDYQQASSNLRSYIPSAQRQPQGVDMAQLVDQIVNGVGQQRQGNDRNRLEKFDLARGGYQGRRGAQDSVARLRQLRVQNDKPQGARGPIADQTKSEVELNATRTAASIHNAISGIGTNQELLVKQLSQATGAERARLKEVYQDLFGESLDDAIDGDTWGEPEFRATLKSLLNSDRREDSVVDDVQATRDAATLHEAMDSSFWDPSSWGTNEEKLREVLSNRSPAEIKRISEVYEQTYGEPLRDAIKGETWDDTINELNSGFQDSLLHQLDQAEGVEYEIAKPTEEDAVRTRATQAAMSIRAAVKGVGDTNEQALINTLSSLSNAEKAELRTIYQEMYGTSVVDDIEWDTSFNFESTLTKLINNDRSEEPATELQATRDAASLHRAIATWGTYDNDLQELLTTRSPAQLRKMSEVYESIYGESAKDAIEWDTSGWYETALVHQLSLPDHE